jgi:hypothetical protein
METGNEKKYKEAIGYKNDVLSISNTCVSGVCFGIAAFQIVPNPSVAILVGCGVVTALLSIYLGK